MKVYQILAGGLSLWILVNACSNENASNLIAAKEDLQNVAQQISSDFAAMQKEVNFLVDETQKLYAKQAITENLKKVDTSQYRLEQNGVFYRHDYEGASAAMVTGLIPVTEEIKTIVYFTEPLDEAFKKIIDRNQEIAQVYYNEKHSYGRIYPGFDILTTIPAKFDVSQFNFYYLADADHNPSKQAVWVNEPYVDPVGRGWMVSLLKPLYINDDLQGVTGLDITISAITNRYLSNRTDIMILSPSGVVITTSERLATLFSLPPFQNHKYVETIKTDTYLADNFNLLKSKDRKIRALTMSVFATTASESSFGKNELEVNVLSATVEKLGWKILLVTRS